PAPWSTLTANHRQRYNSGKLSDRLPRGSHADPRLDPRRGGHFSPLPPRVDHRNLADAEPHPSRHGILRPGRTGRRRRGPGRADLDAFVRKARDLLAGGVHLALVDLFPPSSRDPGGIHTIIWGEDDDKTFQFDSAKPLTCASYQGAPGTEAFVEPVAVGDAL